MLKGGILKILRDDDIEQIHLSALSILWRIGVEVREEQAFQLLKKNGCPTNGSRVRIPAHLVEEAIRLAPSTFTLYGRDPNFKVPVEGRRVFYEPMIGRVNILSGAIHVTAQRCDYASDRRGPRRGVPCAWLLCEP
jgi:trimethylamine--corrinoid protein Co-methyltransferase